MANQNVFSGFQINRPLMIGGVVLTGAGALVGLAGAAMVCVALASAGRGWVRQMDTPPAERAHRALHHAKEASVAAKAAGWETWRNAHDVSSN